MEKAQYAILRFAKYKGPEISAIEAHNERTKEKYASNPDVDISRSKYNFHLIAPEQRYRAEAERQIAAAGCRTRKDSIRMVETLVTASPGFFQKKTEKEVRAYFEEALAFLSAHQDPKTILSAVVHMDEKTPHMHLCFVPLTADGRLSAKEIVGNKKKLTQWQDRFWEHMVKRYPELERGERAGKTGRDHIPPRLFKEAAHLNRQRERLEQLLSEIHPLNAKKRAAEIEGLLGPYLAGVEKMRTSLKKYSAAFREMKEENLRLEKALDNRKESVLRRLEIQQKLGEYEELKKVVDRIPRAILDAWAGQRTGITEHEKGRDACDR